MKKNHINVLDGLVYIALLVILLTIIFGSNIKYAVKKTFLISNFNMVVIIFLLLIVVLFLHKKIDFNRIKKDSKGKKLLFWFSFCIIQCLFSYFLFFGTGWDAGSFVIPSSIGLATNNSALFTPFYFSICPNNIGIVLLFSFILRIAYILFPLFNSYAGSVLFLVGFQCVLSTITGYLIADLTYDLTKSEPLKILSIIVYIILLGLSPWLVIPYTDSTGIVFPILIFKIYKSFGNGKNKTLKFILLAFFTYCGYRIKPQIAIITIAICMVEMFKLFHRHKKIKFNTTHLRQCIIRVICMCSVVLVSQFTYSKLVSHYGFISEENRVLGLPHFLMMGLNERTNGVYDGDDVMYSSSFATNAERNQANLEECIRRVENYQLKGLITHTRKKMLTNFNDGGFAWGAEGNFYASVPERNNKITPILRDVFYNDGKYYIYTLTIQQFVWLFTLLLMFMNCLWMNTDKYRRVLLFSFAGISLFEMLFEARARYFFIYVPLFILMAMNGMKSCIYAFTRVQSKDNDIN